MHDMCWVSKIYFKNLLFFCSVQSLTQSCPTLCDPMNRSTPGLLAHHQLRSLLKLMSIESVMPSNYLILCRPFLLLPSIFPSIGVFWMSQLFASVAKVLEYQLFDISPSNEHPGLISFRMAGWISLQSKGLSRVFSDTTVQNHQFFSAQLSLEPNSHIYTWLLEKT